MPTPVPTPPTGVKTSELVLVSELLATDVIPMLRPTASSAKDRNVGLPVELLGAGGAPQWVAGPQKEGSLVFNAGFVYRVKQDIADGQAPPTPTNTFYLQVGPAVNLYAFPILAITSQGLQGFNTFEDVQRVGGRTIELNKDTVDFADDANLQNILFYGRGNTLRIADGKVVRLGASTNGRSLVFEATITALGTGYIAVTKTNGAITGVPSVLQAPRLTNSFVTAPMRFAASQGNALTLDCTRVASLTNNSQDASNVATVYLLPGSSIDTLGPNINVVQVGSSSGGGPTYTAGTGIDITNNVISATGGAGGTARDPYDVDTAKRKEVVDANVPAYVETDDSYYGKEFVDEVYGPGKPAYYKCMPSAPASTGGATAWKWFRIDIL